MDRDPEITVNYSVTFGEFLSTQSHFEPIKPLYAWPAFIISFFLVGPYIICGAFRNVCALISWPAFYTNFVMGIVYNGFFGLLLFLFVFLAFRLLLLPLLAMLNYKNNKFLLKDVSFTVTPDHIIFKTRITDSIIKWAAVRKVTQNQSLIIMQIMKTPTAVLMIPKRAFENPQQAEAFYNFACENWKKASQ